MISNVGTDFSMARMPFMRNVTKTLPSLSNREAEILAELREKMSSQFGVPVKINHGTRGESGKTVAFTGFMAAHLNGANRAEMFLITPQILSEMAESEYMYEKWTAWIQENIDRQRELGTVFPNNPTAEADTDRRSEQIRANMMSALDFWNENGGEPWTRLGQGQAVMRGLLKGF